MNFGIGSKVINEINEKITVYADYRERLLCKNDTFKIPPNDYSEVQTGGCCLKRLYIITENGEKTKVYDTGLGLSCRSLTFVVRQDSDGKIVAELK